jgi:hypothetical protein
MCCGWGVVAAKFFWYLLFMFLTFCYFTFYGMMVIGLTPSQQLAAIISTFFYSLWNLFCGFLIPVTVSAHTRLWYTKPWACFSHVWRILQKGQFFLYSQFYLFNCKLQFSNWALQTGTHNGFWKVLQLEFVWILAEDTSMVEMVLLSQSNGMDSVWFSGISIGWYNYKY